MKEVKPMDIFEWMKRNGHEQIIFNEPNPFTIYQTGLVTISQRIFLWFVRAPGGNNEVVVGNKYAERNQSHDN